MPKLTYSVSIIGPGKVGSALGNLLIYNGHSLLSVIGTTSGKLRSVKKILRAKKYSTSVADISPKSNVIVITAPGSSVHKIAESLADCVTLDWKRTLVIHTSGADGAELLQPLARLGTKTAAIHPIQSFPEILSRKSAASSLNGIAYGYDAPANSLSSARAFIAALGGKPFRVPAKVRPLYHAMCVFASGYAVQLLHSIEDLRKQLPGDLPWQEIIAPLFFQSVTNAFNTSPLDATTGPIVRGDVQTIRAHIKSLRKNNPDVLGVYRAMGLLTVDNLLSAKKLDKKTAALLRKTLA